MNGTRHQGIVTKVTCHCWRSSSFGLDWLLEGNAEERIQTDRGQSIYDLKRLRH